MRTRTTKATSRRKPAGGPKLQRTTFNTSRSLDFCSRKELVAQTGHATDDWPLVVLKELVENALDACEEQGVPPELKVRVREGSIIVADNGPGLPVDTLEGVMDFNVRASSREAYVSPDRGAQGNGLKTVLAMPFVLEGERGWIDVRSHGQGHQIVFGVDRIRQKPTISRKSRSARFVRNGTLPRLWWPRSACSLEDRKDDFLQLAADFNFLIQIHPRQRTSLDPLRGCETFQQRTAGPCELYALASSSP